MPPFRARPVIDIPVTNHVGLVSATPYSDTTFTDTTVATVRSDNQHDTIKAIDYPSMLSARSIIAPRNANSGGSTTVGIILGSICGFLVLLAIIYVCYFRKHSTMYIVSTTSSSSSKNSQTKRKKRRRRKPIIFGMPRPKDVIVVEIVRTKEDATGAAEANSAAPAAPAAEAPAAA